jgi:two-component system response regulator DegU
MTAIRVAIVDDHQLMRSGLRKLIETEPDIEVVGEAASAAQCIELVKQATPDVVLMDWSMPGETGLDATTRLAREETSARVIMVSMFDSAGFVKQAKLAGAKGYVIKGRSAEELIDAIRQVAGGAPFVYEGETPASGEADGAINSTGIEVLTARQIEILRLIAKGSTNKEIANTLFIAEKTVEHHRMNIKRALGVNDTAKLVLFAVRHGIVTPAELDDPAEPDRRDP